MAFPPQRRRNYSASLKELAQDGYIFVIQNLRGRFKSEGVFKLSSEVDLKDPKATNETTDAYDTIDWLVKNVANNNGKVGIYGVSYDGFTAAMTLLHPHPALKAISEQASPVDQWMNDDDHRFGALRESYDFEYAVLEQADKNKNTHFDFETYDTYQWYLNLGPLSNINAKYLHGSIPVLELTAWNIRTTTTSGRGKRGSISFTRSTVPNLNVAGFWDQEDPWGPWQIFRHAEEHDPGRTNFIVAGPWYHGEWQTPQRREHRDDSIWRTRHARANSAKTSKRRSFAITCTGRRKAGLAGKTFQTGSNHLAHVCGMAAEGIQADESVSACGWNACRSSAAEEAGKAYREYLSDPANPVPYRQRPISPTYPAGDWRTWEVADQRFVDHRPDVLTFDSAPLDHDVTMTGNGRREVVCVDFGNGQRFCGEADRCVSGRCAEECVGGRSRARSRDNMRSR